MSERAPVSQVQPSAAAPAAPPAPDVEAQARAAQAALVLRRARPSNLLGPPVGLLIGWLLWGAVDHTRLVAWFALLVLTTGWREWVYRQFERDLPSRARHWGQRYLFAVCANGLTYGGVGSWLLPVNNPPMAAMLMATVVGIAAVGVVVLSSRLAAALALCLPVLLPAIVTQLAHGTRLSTYTGLAMAVFLGLVVVEGRQAARHTLSMLRLRFRMDDLALQRQQALDLAERSSAVKSQFLATMSHEMRTPLHGILGLTRMLRSGTLSSASRDEQLEMIERTGEHLLGLINGVLDHSKIEVGHLRLAPAVLDLAELVASVVELARVAATEKGLQLVLQQSLPVPYWVELDGSRLRQVLLNIVGNAVKFTHAGSVTVAVRRGADQRIEFQVTDSGPGVPPAEREAIFEAFHQADGSFGRKHGGTGLGLTISRDLARAMGGDVVCTEGFGGGARFVLTLPVPTARPADSVAPPPPAPEFAAALRGHVLLAEDNPVNALVAEALLRHVGLTLDHVDNGLAAVLKASRTRYDLILMDCQMPGLDGFEATAQIRDRERAAGATSVPIVALTANALEVDRQRSIDCGMNDHMAKPFRDDELRSMLQRYLVPA